MPCRLQPPCLTKSVLRFTKKLHHWRCYHSVTLIRKLSQSLNSDHRLGKNQGEIVYCRSYWLSTSLARTDLSDTCIPPPVPLALPLEDQTWGMCTCWYLKYTGINYSSQRRIKGFQSLPSSDFGPYFGLLRILCIVDSLSWKLPKIYRNWSLQNIR